MDDSYASDFGSDYESLPETSQTPKPAFSGIKLVLPSLSSVKSKGKQKKKNGKDKVKGPPRPLKLKPLKEVLTGLMVRMKKKDDYAIFLAPVDASQIPGYADVIKRPMDLGTMSAKVDRGRYRSLDEFADDLRLVTGNAKLFNPPGNLFHTEAERLESFSLNIIDKARTTVLQYETDWNIDVEGDDENVELEDTYEQAEPSTPIPTTDSRASYEPTEVEFGLRRRTRAPAQKAESKPPAVSESVDAEGRLPGSKDGLGAFPAGSDWANMVLALKLRGKRYKTKKERLKIEKDGPPYRADGSLDYTALEDPISVLAPLIPEPSLSRLHLLHGDATKLLPKQTQPTHRERYGTYFTLVRNAPRAKQREQDLDEPSPLVERQANMTDFGSLSVLSREVEAELQRREVFSDENPEERVVNHIRESLDISEISITSPDTDNTYWTRQRAVSAEDHLRDVVYGGADGLAYVRSLAEFVQSPSLESQTILTKHVEEKILASLTEGRHGLLRATAQRLSPNHTLNPKHPLDAQVARSLLIPTALRQLPAIWHDKIDLGVLVKSPEELATLEGKNDLGSDILSRSLGTLAQYIVEASSKPPVPDPKPLSLLSTNAAVKMKSEDSDAMEVDSEGSTPLKEAPKPQPPKVTYALAHENLRLQLLALVKRAPVEALGSVPPHLLPRPEHIRPVSEVPQSDAKAEI